MHKGKQWWPPPPEQHPSDRDGGRIYLNKLLKEKKQFINDKLSKDGLGLPYPL